MAPAQDITVRKLHFELPDRLDPLEVVVGFPEESLVNVALSLLLPYLEPYLIRSMHQAKASVKDPGLAADIDNFSGQEGQHYRQHKRFNDVVRQGVPGLEAFEERLSSDYHRFSEQRSLRFNLAYAEGFEAYTSAMALFSLEVGLLERFHPGAKALFQWHLVEELEHRTVAFDVYQYVVGNYLYRVVVGLYAQWHMSRWIMSVADHLLRANERRWREEFGGFKGMWTRTRPLLWKMLRTLLPRVLKTYLPWYDPRGARLPAELSELTARYSALAKGGAP